MKPMDLLRYMDKVDHKYVAEASDRGVQVYRKRRLAVRLTLAACLAVVILTGAVLAKPTLYVWETRNTVTSWSNPYLQIPGVHEKPSSSLLVSAELPAQKKLDAATPFTLSAGFGQASGFEYATLSVKAYGFEITDKDGNTVRDRYVRTVEDFNSGDFGLVYEDSFGQRHRTGCQYFEDFTFRFVGDDTTTGWGPIEISLLTRDEGSYQRERVTVYYTVENGVLKLSRKNPVKGNENGGGHAVLVPEDEEVIPTEDNIAVRAELSDSILHPGDYCFVEMTARLQPRGEIYPTDSFTAALRYAETVGGRDYSFYISAPGPYAEMLGLDQVVLPVPKDAPAGTYDLVITDQETGFEWVFENMVWILPHVGDSEENQPAYEDFSCNVKVSHPTLAQGEYWPGAVFLDLTLDGQDRSLFCTVELVFAEDGGEACTITLKEPAYSSNLPFPYIPADAPVGGYDLVITEQRYGYIWRYNHAVEITENPDAPRFVFYTDIQDVLTVSRSSKTVYRFNATMENRGSAFTVPSGLQFCPIASLTGEDPTATGILCKVVTTAGPVSGETVRTGQTGTCQYELVLTPNTGCGLYDLTLSFPNNYYVTIPHAVKVVE